MTEHTPSLTPTPEEAATLVRAAQQADQDRPDVSHAPDDRHSDGFHMPSPSIWPMVAAFGITMISFGILTGWAFGIFGGVVLAISLWKWAGEMRSDAA